LISHFTRYALLLIFFLFSAVFYADYVFQQKQSPHILIPLNESIASISGLCRYHECSIGNEYGKITILSKESLLFPSSLNIKLDEGNIIQVRNGSKELFAYAAIENSDIVLRYGPFTLDDFDERVWYTTIFYSLLALAIFAGLFPIFREMTKLKQSAELFAKSGDLSALPTAKSAFFKPVNIAFATMVTKIARLLALQKELSDTLSHEIRTPLSRIRFAQQALTPKNIEQFKSDMELDLVEMESLVEEHLSFSRLEHEEPLLEKECVSVVPIIEKHVELFDKFTKKSVKLIIEQNAHIYVEIDEVKFSRAVKNLIDNACKYAISKVTVTIKSSDNNKSLVVFVEDDGPGIRDKQIDDLFLPYTRIKGKVTKGFGLGLAITRKIILWHEGNIKVVPSKKLGGACFVISIPISLN